MSIGVAGPAWTAAVSSATATTSATSTTGADATVSAVTTTSTGTTLSTVATLDATSTGSALCNDSLGPSGVIASTIMFNARPPATQVPASTAERQFTQWRTNDWGVVLVLITNYTSGPAPSVGRTTNLYGLKTVPDRWLSPVPIAGGDRDEIVEQLNFNDLLGSDRPAVGVHHVQRHDRGRRSG